jgi:ParB family chromosome partitioning protein
MVGLRFPPGFSFIPEASFIMDEVAKYKEQLPANIGELKEFILIGKEKLKLHKAKINAINNSNMADEVYNIALNDGQDAGIAVIFAEVKLGELLKENKPKFSRDNLGKIKAEETLPPDIDKKFSHEAQTLAKNPDKVEESIAKTIKAGKIPTPDTVYKEIKKPHVSNNSGENEWYTPDYLIESAKIVMGNIDLDPASSKLANQIIKAKKYFDINSNGLDQKWYGNVWLNPPYSQPLISQFSDKINTEINNFTQACILTNNATETEWYQNILINASVVCFLKSRIKFIDLNGNPSGAPLQGQSIIYIGKKSKEFYNEFKKYGICLKRII